MPTGYTNIIEDGATFEQFIKRCARAFTPLISMKDAPMDAEIPEKLEPSDYHANALKKSVEEFEELVSLTTSEIVKRRNEHYEKMGEERARYSRERKELKRKYEAMLEQVKAWEPDEKVLPLKKFAIKQLIASMDCDCSEYDYETEKLSADKWFAQQKKNILDDIEYHRKKYDEEVERTGQRNEWLEVLRRSLNE